MADNEHRVLGLACGQLRGSAELLLKAALQSAGDAGATVELVRLDDLRIPSGPDSKDLDDVWWFWDRLVDCDAFIISTPLISRTVAARLKLLGDRLLGPNADVAITEKVLALRHAGSDSIVPFRIDERLIKPRVGGFLAVGGSLCQQWKTLVLPVMHTMTFSMSTAVVDQVQFEGAGLPRSIVLDDAAMARARQLGSNVASQLGKGLNDAEYLGPPGLCPMCHLSVILFEDAPEVSCATCGARGTIGAENLITWTDLTASVISMDERRAHALEILEIAAKQQPRLADIESLAAGLDAFEPIIRPSSAVSPQQ